MIIYLIGIGMGSLEGITCEAVEKINNCDLIIGAERMVKGFNKPKFISYKAEEIADFLRDKAYKEVCILLSGDIGFYSGARGLYKALADYELRCIAGISTVSYFASKLKMPWQDIKLTSLHGVENNIVGYIRDNKRVFALLNGEKSINELCAKLCRYGFGACRIYIGERLSYPDEKISILRAEDVKAMTFESLSAVIIENEKPLDRSLFSVADEDFIRGSVPMTKGEVRTVSISKLQLNKASVVYDIGAGTGSVAVECGIKAVDGRVYAVEKNPDAISLLEQNKLKFAVDNMEIIEGTAPRAIEALPVPTHVFIGGSSGNLREIINKCLEKNPKVRIVINAVSLNTVAEASALSEEFSVFEAVQLSLSRSEKIGSYHLMKGLNPVYIFTLQNKGE